jgi:outer membrane PBP1 activator LpoA protein
MTAPRREVRIARCHARWRCAAIALALAFGLPALSAAQSPPASDGAPDRSAGTAPEASAKAAPDPGAKAAPTVDAQLTPLPIVLVLPLASTAFGRAAEAVQAGFLAAADAAKAKPTVIGHGDGDVVAAFAKAKDSGARVIVGPLVRDDMKILAAAGLELPPTIALNQLDEGVTLPENVYALTLTIDGEARQLARRAREDGAMTVVVIASDTPRQQRFASAFNAEWILAGGGAPVMFRLDSAPEVLRLLRRELAKTPVDTALLAVDAKDAALVKPFVGTIPSYTSSQVNERQPPETLRDLDDVRFVDMPWLVEADAAAFAELKRPDYPNTTLDRLYALGVDAFRVAQAFADGSPTKLEFDGATGHLSLDATRRFVREGRLMQFRAGRIVPVGAR